MTTIRINKEEMQDVFIRILHKNGFEDDRAKQCAAIFTESSTDGVYTHGVNRFAKFIEYIRLGVIDVKAAPKMVYAAGAIEQWDGQLGPGPLNAVFAVNRAMEFARESGIGCLALANTNHWMRGGTYGWQAAKKGFVFIGWTNTLGNMPAWGATDSRLGNNPLVLAVPYKSEAIVLDIAMSQFSYGTMELYKIKDRKLSVSGGFDNYGNLTDDPASILESERALPMGYWKGAGLSLLLDILATILSAGLSVKEISKHKSEHALSQVFIAIDISRLKNFPAIEKTIDDIINDYLQSVPGDNMAKIVYPGQRVLKDRLENSRKGIPVDKAVWGKILTL